MALAKWLKPHEYVFDTTGVTIIRGQIPLDQLTSAANALDRIHGAPQKYPWKFPIMTAGRIFWDFMTHPVTLQMAAAFCGPHFRMDHAFGVSSNGAHPQLHGGPQSSQYSCFFAPLPSGEQRAICGQLNVGVCLFGQSESTGGFCYVPGSHKQSDPRAGREILQEVYSGHFDHSSIVVPRLNPGDIIIFTEALVHGDTGWKGSPGHGLPRTQLYYKFTPGWMCWRDPEANKAYEHLATTELERRLLAPPWTGRYTETASEMGFDNQRRPAT